MQICVVVYLLKNNLVLLCLIISTEIICSDCIFLVLRGFANAPSSSRTVYTINVILSLIVKRIEGLVKF